MVQDKAKKAGKKDGMLLKKTTLPLFRNENGYLRT